MSDLYKIEYEGKDLIIRLRGDIADKEMIPGDKV